MMVKVAAYRLKYIHLQIYNFHLEEATFLDKITGTPNSRKGGFPYSSNKKMYQIPRPHDTKPAAYPTRHIAGGRASPRHITD